MPEFAQSLGFDLPDPFSGHVELLPHFLQRPGLAVVQTVTQAQHLGLPGRQAVQNIHQLLLEQGGSHGFGRSGRIVIRNEVSQMGIVLFADRGFQRYRLLSNLDDFPHLLFRNAHFLGDLIGAGLPAILLYQLPIYPDYDTGVDADYSYQSDELRIAIKKVVDEENVLTYFVADIWLRNYRSFRTAFGNGDFNSGTESADSMCQRERAVLGITGSYNNGLTLHNGVRYKGISRELTREICVIYRDGKMKTMDYSAAKFNDKKAVENGAWQAWQFGPIFISDGVAKDGYKENATRHPRCMLGYYEPGHYVLVLVDGRQGKEGYSIGMNYYEQVELMKSLGCVEAYNLDGGESVRMVFMGEIINHPSGDRDGDGVADRNLLDMLVFAEYDLEGNAPSYEEVADKVTIRTTVE